MELDVDEYRISRSIEVDRYEAERVTIVLRPFDVTEEGNLTWDWKRTLGLWRPLRLQVLDLPEQLEIPWRQRLIMALRL